MTKPHLAELPIDAFLDGPNIRTIDVDDELKELARSLARQGFLAPVGAVESAAGHVETFYGFRRLAAYRWALREGLPVPELVPVLLYPETLDLVEREAIQIVENLQRKDLNDVESYHAVKSLAARGLSLEEVGDRINKSKATVCKWLSPDRCPEEAKSHFLAGRLSLGQCYQISTSADPLETMRAFLRGASHAEAGKPSRPGRGEPSPDETKEKTPKVTIPLPPGKASRAAGVVTITAKPGQEMDWDEAEKGLQKALDLVKEAKRAGMDLRPAQTGWKAAATAKPMAETAH